MSLLYRAVGTALWDVGSSGWEGGIPPSILLELLLPVQPRRLFAYWPHTAGLCSIWCHPNPPKAFSEKLLSSRPHHVPHMPGVASPPSAGLCTSPCRPHKLPINPFPPACPRLPGRCHDSLVHHLILEVLHHHKFAEDTVYSITQILDGTQCCLWLTTVLLL